MKRLAILFCTVLFCGMVYADGKTVVVIPTDTDTVCQSELPYLWRDSIQCDSSGFYVDTVSNDSIDSVFTLSLVVNQNPVREYNDTICYGRTYTFYGRVLSETGDYADTISNEGGCDSIITLHLQVRDELRPGVISVNDNDTVVCRGTAVQILSESLPTGGSGFYLYRWMKREDGGAWQTVQGETSASCQNQTVNGETYFCRLDIDSCCGDTVRTDTVLINVFATPTKPHIATNTPNPLCYMNRPTLTIDVQSYSSNDSVVYSWFSSADGVNFVSVGSSDITYTPGSGLSDSVYYKVSASQSHGCDTVFSDPLLVLVYEELTNRIGGDTAVCYNRSATLSVTVAGAGGVYNEYVWYESADTTQGWSTVGTNNDTLVTTPSTTPGTRYYKCRVSSVHCGEKESTVIAVKTYSQLQAGLISINTDTICYGSSTSIMSDVDASGARGINTYSWQKSEDEDVWTDVSQTGKMLTSTGNLYVTTSFRRIVSNGVCGESETTNVVKINVRQPIQSPDIVNPNTDSLCYNDIPQPLTLTNKPVPVYGDTLTYEWFELQSNGSWSTLGVLGDTCRFSSGHTESHQYKVIAHSSTGCQSIPLSSVSINVRKPLSVNVAGSKDVTLCYNDYTVISVNTTGATRNYTYRWEQSTDSINWVDADNDTYTSSLTTLNHIGTHYYYRCVVKDLTCNDTVLSDAVSVKTDKQIQPGVLNEPNSIGYCFGDDVGTLSFRDDAKGPEDKMTWVWQQKAKGFNDFSDISGTDKNNTYKPGSSLADTTEFRVRYKNGNCDSAYSNIIKVCINPRPRRVDIFSDNDTVCSNETHRFFIKDYNPQLYDYSWSKGDGVELATDSIADIGWEKVPTSGNDVVRLTITDKGKTKCDTVCEFNVNIQEGIDTFRVLRKRGSNILYCPDCDSSFYFTWQQNGTSVVEGKGKRYWVVENADLGTSNDVFSLTLRRYQDAFCHTYNEFKKGSDDTGITVSRKNIINVAIKDGRSIEVKIENPDGLPVNVTLFNVSGIAFGSYDLGSEVLIEKQIDVALAKGVYMLRVVIGEEVSTIKLIAE